MPSPAFSLHTVHRAADFFEQCRAPRETLERLLAVYLGEKRHWRIVDGVGVFMDIFVDDDPERFLTKLLGRPEGPVAFRGVVEALLRVFDPAWRFRDEYDALINHSVGRHPLWGGPYDRDPLPHLHKCHARLLEALREEGYAFDGTSGTLKASTDEPTSRPGVPVEGTGNDAGGDRPIRVVLGEDGKVFLDGEILTVEPDLMRRFCRSYREDEPLRLTDIGEQAESQVDTQRRVNRLRTRLKKMAGREIIESSGRGTCAYQIVSESIILP